MYKGMRLSVCIPTRDREVLTSKAIESVIKTSKCFDDLRIYVFDNLSNPSPSRIQLFSKLLSDGKIQYYSYDSMESLQKCFGKAYIFKRFIQMMKTEHELRKYTDKENQLEDFYLLLDSDFILGEGWPDFFVRANRKLRDLEPNLHYFVKYIGGVPKSSREHPVTRTHILKTKDGREFKVMCAVFGGGSGFWLMSYDQLCKLEWPTQLLMNTYKQYKRHDTSSWALIHNKFKGIYTRYVAAVMPLDSENPLVLHMGEVLKTSMCNVLTRQGPAAYRRMKQNFSLKELELKDMSAKEIYDKYKMLDSATIW